MIWILVTGAALALVAAFWPSEREREAERQAIGQEVLDQALNETRRAVDVPPEVEARFTVRFWRRWRRLFGRG